MFFCCGRRWETADRRVIASNGHIKFDTAEARKNVPSLELYYDGGHYIYGLNMFHQIHCLVSPWPDPMFWRTVLTWSW